MIPHDNESHNFKYVPMGDERKWLSSSKSGMGYLYKNFLPKMGGGLIFKITVRTLGD